MNQNVEAPNATATPLVPVLRAVLLADLVDSTALLQRLGDARTAALMQRLELHLRDLLTPTRGQLIDKADGVLVLFERPINAVDFALRYQHMLVDLAREFDLPPLLARVGIHVGEVMTWANDPRAVAAGAKPIEVEGLAKPVAARLMSLALPGQILLSGMAQTLAERAAGELGDRGADLRWRLHGRYRFKGVPIPMLVHEVGEQGLSPLRPPPSGPKVWRELPLWRRPPVLALEVLVAIGIAAASLYGTFKSEPALAFNQRDWVVVGDINNLSDNNVLQDPLDAALRIGLQQSTYVNVISDSRVAETLRRMGRPLDTPIDRALGAEIAAREGARAVIIPTLTSVGGELQFTVELVDPTNQATMYSDTATSEGNAHILEAVDDVLRDLREQLGESLASINDTSKPLEQVTTGDLNALRAYTLGVAARGRSDFAEAEAYFKKATDLDPQFALAYLGRASMRLTGNDNKGALQFLELAEKNRARLTDREAMLVDAAHSLMRSSEPVLKEWKVLAAMYPDEFRAYYNYAYFAHHDAAQYQAALEALMPALTPQNPDRGSAYYLRGVLLLSLDELDQALESFVQAESLGVRGDLRAYAETYAAKRNFVKAYEILNAQTNTGDESVSIEQRLGDISFAVDEGRWSDANRAAVELEGKAADAERVMQWTQRGVSLSLRSYDPDSAFASDLQSFARNQNELLPNASVPDARNLRFNMLASAWMAAHTGDVGLAKELIQTAGSRTPEFPANRDMELAARAELELADSKPEHAIQLLQQRTGQPDALFFLHAVLMRAYAAVEDWPDALRQAEWLAHHRGRAYGEFNSLGMWQPANIIESKLALRAASEYARKLGDASTGQKREAEFASAWPAAARNPAVRRRFGS
jgi:putative peptide modification system cyclase